MIFTRSPYYISVDRSSVPTDYTISLYIWTGDILSVPATAEYSLTKQNPESLSSNDMVNISPLVNDFITTTAATPNATPTASNNAVWVKWEVYLENEITPNQEDTVIAYKGYSYGNQGLNYQETKNIFLNGNEYKAARWFAVPVQADNTYTLKSFPNLNIDNEFIFAASTQSSGKVRVIWVDMTLIEDDEYIEVSDGVESIYIYPQEADKYTPVNIHFINKNGQQATMSFLRQRTDKISVEREDYMTSLTSGHQFINYNVNGRTTVTVESGYFDEDANQGFKELMLSEKAWLYTGSAMTPINIDKNSIEFKKRVNDLLISYSFDFKLSYTEINTF